MTDVLSNVIDILMAVAAEERLECGSTDGAETA